LKSHGRAKLFNGNADRKANSGCSRPRLYERRIGANGKPSMQFICKLSSIDEEQANPDGAIEARDHFWHAASARLGRLFRLTDRDLDEIEAAIADRIGPRPLPTTEESPKVNRGAHPIRGPHQPITLRTPQIGRPMRARAR
jgi:hypothetical protein